MTLLDLILFSICSASCLRLLFYRRSDHLWVEAIPDARWVALLDALDLPAMPREQGSTAQRMQTQMLEALQVLSYRIAAIGLEPELVRLCMWG